MPTPMHVFEAFFKHYGIVGEDAELEFLDSSNTRFTEEERDLIFEFFLAADDDGFDYQAALRYLPAGKTI